MGYTWKTEWINIKILINKNNKIFALIICADLIKCNAIITVYIILKQSKYELWKNKSLKDTYNKIEQTKI